MDFPLQLFKCSIQGMPVNTIFFTDIGQINKIEHHAINLTDMSWFTWHNVTINEIEPLGMQVFMEKDKQFTIKQSQVSKVGYRGIILRAHSIFFNQTDILEIEKFGITATVYWFDFTNSKIGIVHPKGFHLLAQNVNIMNNSFSQLEPKAFHGIGPGLLENALVSFGRLRFTYVFSKNKILQANVGSLNPDWEAYKNVKTFLNFTLNHLPCSCSELGWVNLDDGIGSGLADTVSFSTRIMEKKSQNMCVDAPCLLPLGVMSIMHFVNGSCQKASGLKEVCNKFINNKDFRTNILTESEKFTRNRASHMSLDLHSVNNVDETLIADHPFPIVPVKSNIIEKKTEYLNDWNSDNEVLSRKLSPSIGLRELVRFKRTDTNSSSEDDPENSNSVESDQEKTPRKSIDFSESYTSTNANIIDRNTRDIKSDIKLLEQKAEEKRIPSDADIKNKTKGQKTGAYKVNWKMITKSEQKDSMVFVPKIIEEPTGTFEVSDAPPNTTISEENSPIPITIRPFKTKDDKTRKTKGKVSIHEQISNIAEKLTKDIEQQVQERHMLEAEEEEAAASVEDPARLEEMYELKRFSQENSYDKRRLILPENIGGKKSVYVPKKGRYVPSTTTRVTEPDLEWDPVKKMEENNHDSLIYKELVQVQQKLQKQYNNQTFPIPLVRKTRI